jgi:hypothetical protein
VRVNLPKGISQQLERFEPSSWCQGNDDMDGSEPFFDPDPTARHQAASP